MKALWTQEAASYEGRYVSFEDSAAWPKPVQRPHPPILVGGNGERVLDRVLRYGDGWFPNREARLGERVAELQRRAAEAGRGPVPVTYFGADADRGAVERLTAAGVDRILFYLPSAPADEVERAVDGLAELVAA
jgi:alkanesulfonate monooxygenase SsuD/methylene tetrahydromethanopterin reductase-like flavin-dependent oxidoreductase (luciferase family)